MEVVLKLNARLQPMHRHELEDAIQGVLCLLYTSDAADE